MRASVRFGNLGLKVASLPSRMRVDRDSTHSDPGSRSDRARARARIIIIYKPGLSPPPAPPICSPRPLLPSTPALPSFLPSPTIHLLAPTLATARTCLAILDALYDGFCPRRDRTTHSCPPPRLPCDRCRCVLSLPARLGLRHHLPARFGFCLPSYQRAAPTTHRPPSTSSPSMTSTANTDDDR